MLILTVVQGLYGQRITANLRQAHIPGWVVESLSVPVVLPPVIDYPEEYLPTSVPDADLVLALGEHPGVAELLPDIVRMCGGCTVIAPVDNVAWLPPGLMNQLAKWLSDMGVAAVFPKPFCSLTETTYGAYHRQESYDVPLVAEFARHFGQPVFTIDFQEGNSAVAAVQVLRDSPCGCAQHVANGLAGISVEEAEQAAGMLHHHFPCLAGMAIDPAYNDTLMHVSGHLLMDEVSRHVKPHKQPPHYLRPNGKIEEHDL